MALQVKSSLLQREERILVAIDVAVRKMEKLSMITTLCHHFSAASTNRNCWLEKLSSVLEKEAIDILKELISCQKGHYDYIGSTAIGLQDSSSQLVPRVDRKKNLIHRLKESPEKRKFLRDVMTQGKIFLNENVGVYCQATDLSSGNTIGPPMYSSVVGLLRAALKSRYRQHVLRCFKELDVESLMNIFYLIMPSSSKIYLYDEPDGPSPLSSITMKDPILGEDIESHYYVESPITSEGSIRSMFWDDEETIVSFVEDLEDVSRDDQQEKSAGIISAESQHWDNHKIRIFEMQEKFRKPIVSYSSSSQILVESQDNIFQLKVVDLYKKLANLITIANVEAVGQLLSDNVSSDNNERKLGVDEPKTSVENLIRVLYFFRSLVWQMFTSTTRATKFLGRKFNGNTIQLQLLTIEEDKLKETMNQAVSRHKEKQKYLDDLVMEWQYHVDEARRHVEGQLRNLIKNHVAAEMSIGKTRKNEIGRFERNLDTSNDTLANTKAFVKQTVKSLRGRRHYLEASLEALKRQYDATMLKYQAKMDERSLEEAANNKEITRLQNKFKNVEEKYDEMRAMKRLKQILQNMEKAEAIKQNWAARKIQVAWRKYKVAKLRKKKLKGKKKGKKKTPPPGKGTSPPTKSSTPGSRSKSQTP